MKNIYITFILVFSFVNITLSQTQNEDSLFQNRFYIGANVSVFNSKITASSNLELNSKNYITFSESVETGYYFSKNIGISAGFGMSTYKTDLSLATYSNTFNAVDSESEEFQMSVSSSNVSENQKITYFDIPITVLLRFAINKKIGFYLNPGIKLSFISKADYNGNGIFSYEGYYPEYNVTLHNIDEYGYPTNYTVDKLGETGLAKLNKSFIATAGIYLQFKKFNIAVGAYYDRGLGNIYEGDPANYILSRNPDNYNSLLGSSEKTLTQAIGGCISIKYFLR